MKFNRGRVILGLYVLAFILSTELLGIHFKLPVWPAFVAWVLFFGEHMNPRSAPPILIGAAVGIGLVMLAPPAIGVLARLIGPEWGQGLALMAPNPDPRLWLLMEAVGGGLLIGATVIIGRILATPRAAEAAY
ncbi:MAG: hypothetical protein WBW93_05660 [Steroidobacteraceae bacterium]